MDPRTLPFDQYQRYRLVQELLETWLQQREAGAPARILDVGGFARNLSGNPYRPLALFLPDEEIWAYDLHEWEHPSYVQIDPDPAKFPEERFDAVVACDVLEHVPPSSRQALVEKMLETARELAIIIGPLESDLTNRCERLANLLHRRLTGQDDPWLAEHVVNGLPSEQTITEILERRSLPFAVVDSGYVHRWLLMMIARIYLRTLPDFEELLGELNRLYNEFFYGADQRRPGYRKAFVVATGSSSESILEVVGERAASQRDSDREGAGHESLQLMASALLLAGQSPDEQLVDGRWETDSLRGPVWGPHEVDFEFVCPEDRLCRVDLFLATYLRRISGSVEIVVEGRDGSNETSRHVELPGPSIHDNHWHPIRFPDFRGSAGRRYRIRVKGPDLTREAPIALYADESGRPAYRLYCRTSSAGASEALESALAREEAARAELEDGERARQGLEAAQQELQQRLARQEGRSEALSASLAAMEGRLTEASREAERLRQEITALSENLRSGAAERDRLDAELQDSRRQLAEAQQREERLHQEIQELHEGRRGVDEALENERERAAELEARLEATRRAVEQSDSERRRMLLELVAAASVED